MDMLSRILFLYYLGSHNSQSLNRNNSLNDTVSGILQYITWRRGLNIKSSLSKPSILPPQCTALTS